MAVQVTTIKQERLPLVQSLLDAQNLHLPALTGEGTTSPLVAGRTPRSRLSSFLTHLLPSSLPQGLHWMITQVS